MGSLLSTFASWLRQLLLDLWQWVVDLVQSLVDWLEAAVVWVLAFAVRAVAALLALIPVPSFVADFSNVLSGISADVGYWVGPFRIGTGVAIVLAAYATRFLIRRLPFIG